MNNNVVTIRKIESIESERMVLGALLLDSSCFKKINEDLSAEDFSKTLHREIFEKICQFMEQGGKFDAPLICESLKLNKSCQTYVYELANECPSMANIKSYSDIIREKSIQRKLISVANEIAKMAKNGDSENIDQILAEAQHKVEGIYDNGN